MRVLIVLALLGLVACDSADGDPAQANVTTKPAQVAPNKGE